MLVLLKLHTNEHELYACVYVCVFCVAFKCSCERQSCVGRHNQDKTAGKLFYVCISLSGNNLASPESGFYINNLLGSDLGSAAHCITRSSSTTRISVITPSCSPRSLSSLLFLFPLLRYLHTHTHTHTHLSLIHI